MKLFFLGAFIALSHFASAQQDTIFISKQNKETTRDSAEFFRFKEVNGDLTFVKDYYMNGVLQMTGSYSSFKPPMKQGVFLYYSKENILTGEYNYVDNKQNGEQKSYFESGKIMTVRHYSNGKLDGEFMSYYPDGNVKRREQYENDKMTDGKCYGVTGADTTYYAFEIMPEFPGGEIALIKYISSHLKYPKEARRKNIEGRVYVAFVVDKQGYVKDVRILRGVDSLLDEAAVEIVRGLPQWKPGRQDGKAVVVQYNLPVNYRLKD